MNFKSNMSSTDEIIKFLERKLLEESKSIDELTKIFETNFFNQQILKFSMKLNNVENVIKTIRLKMFYVINCFVDHTIILNYSLFFEYYFSCNCNSFSC